MARVALSEYAAKTLLNQDNYAGVTVTAETDFSKLKLPNDALVVKVDDGTKKRNKLGLVKVGVTDSEAIAAAKDWLDSGYVRILIEPMVTHEVSEEKYISLTLEREGVKVLYSDTGGGDVEASSENVVTTVIPRAAALAGEATECASAPLALVNQLLAVMSENHLSFVEINPFLQSEKGFLLLDAAVEADSAHLHRLPDWIEAHVQGNKGATAAEKTIAQLEEQSTAAFSLTVFNPDAEVFTLLSGGGASLVTLDTLVDEGLQAVVGNYGEYSGAPTREETRIYAGELLKLLFASTAKRKVLVIAGGVANFTDVMTTFAGIVDACSDHIDAFKEQSVMVRVRRGGPRQAEGLAHLEQFFAENGITAVVSDPSVPLSQVAIDVKNYLHA